MSFNSAPNEESELSLETPTQADERLGNKPSQEALDAKYLVNPAASIATPSVKQFDPAVPLDDDGLPQAVESFDESQRIALGQVYSSYTSTGLDSSFEGARNKLSDLEVINSVKKRLSEEIDALNNFEYGKPTNDQAYGKLIERVKIMRKAFPGFSLGKIIKKTDGKDITGTVSL